jgi:hypothetical protein
MNQLTKLLQLCSGVMNLDDRQSMSIGSLYDDEMCRAGVSKVVRNRATRHDGMSHKADGICNWRTRRGTFWHTRSHPGVAGSLAMSG